jgi:hypothetical protein
LIILAGCGAISILAAISIITAPLTLAGTIMGLAATLTGLVNSKEKELPRISLFGNLSNV